MTYPFHVKLFIVAAGLQVIFLIFFFSSAQITNPVSKKEIALPVGQGWIFRLNICPSSFELHRASEVEERSRHSESLEELKQIICDLKLL